MNSNLSTIHYPNYHRAIGVGQEFDRASNLTQDDYLDYCDKSPLLSNNKQRSLCRLHPKIMSIVARGLRMAIDECQTRFASNRWNCSIILEDSINNQNDLLSNSNNNNNPNINYGNSIRSGPQIFGEVMLNPNRERSYLNAIIAAGLARAMTKACSAGELPDECSCDRKIRSKSNKGRVEWVACSDDIDYGARFSRDFTDNLDPNEPDTTATIYLHNNEVGRRVFKSATDITCTCQNPAENGSCQTKRCWKHLGSFADVGDELIKRYESATHVQRSSKDPHKLRPVRRGVRRPKRKDLVYISESPDYCQADSR